jgi:CII-binding regulator of phage lambda lysogenization HflD
MNIEITNNQNFILTSNLDSIKEFGIILNKISSYIKMSHWFINDYNTHKLLGEMYSDLDELFDKLQEEIIGTSEKYKVQFPKFNVSLFQIECLEDYSKNNSIINKLHNILDELKNILTTLEFNDYCTKVKSGIANTKDEILSTINEKIYLLSMIKLI